MGGSKNACAGGQGGQGGNGGPGGGGLGGPSAAITYVGAAVAKDAATTLTPGTAGDGWKPTIARASAVAGAGFGAFFVLISRSGEDSGLWPLASARSVAVVVVGAAVLLTGVRRVERTGVHLAIAAGSFDVAANALFLLASRQGLLTLVGVIGSMYPASTIVLARVVLRERIARHQMTGLALAAASLVAVTIG